MKFIPYTYRIEIEPIAKNDEVLSTMGEKKYLEMGKVIAIGEGVEFAKVGDILFFAAHGIFETPEVDGVRHYVVEEESEFILGKYERTTEPV